MRRGREREGEEREDGRGEKKKSRYMVVHVPGVLYTHIHVCVAEREGGGEGGREAISLVGSSSAKLASLAPYYQHSC